MTDPACARCGQDPAPGHAQINGKRYCHGDDAIVTSVRGWMIDRETLTALLPGGPTLPTCYEAAQAEHTARPIEQIIAESAGETT